MFQVSDHYDITNDPKGIVRTPSSSSRPVLRQSVSKPDPPNLKRISAISIPQGDQPVSQSQQRMSRKPSSGASPNNRKPSPNPRVNNSQQPR